MSRLNELRAKVCYTFLYTLAMQYRACHVDRIAYSRLWMLSTFNAAAVYSMSKQTAFPALYSIYIHHIGIKKVIPRQQQFPPDKPAMGLMASHQLSDEELKAYQDATGLSLEQLEQLYHRFRALDRRQLGYLTPTDLLRIPQLAQNPLHRQIIDGFFANAAHTDRIDFGEFVRTCATFMLPQFAPMPPEQRWDGRQQKLRLLSHMFDTKRSGHIERSDFRRAMHYMLNGTAATAEKPNESLLASNGNKDLQHQLQLLEEQAFGRQQTLPYALFEQRFSAIDVQSRLAISKWLISELPEEDEEAERQSVATEGEHGTEEDLCVSEHNTGRGA